MLIVNGELNVEEFKKVVKELDWRKVPRGTSSFTEVFYSGKLEDSDRIVHVTLRPSKRIAISESFKNRTLDGEVPDSGYKGRLVNFGTTIELLVDDKFVQEVSAVAKERESTAINKKLEW